MTRGLREEHGRQAPEVLRLPEGATPDDCDHCPHFSTAECSDCPENPGNYRRRAGQTDLGDLLVFKGPPDDNNPHRGNSIVGEERGLALITFKDRLHTGAYTFWHVPRHGSPRRITDPEEIRWGDRPATE
jgi:hypothetical protein